ncbi:MAG: solute carrier family 26 protein [Saprospiraceae bacterium]
MRWSSVLPVLDWLPKYQTSDLRGDLSAGLTVGVMLIPQGMAYAMLAGLPPIYGLYASTIPLLIYALFGTSRQLAVGPVAMVSLLTAAGVGLLAETGTEHFITLAIALSLFTGIMQFLLGVFRLGFLVNFLSYPVISGFTSAAALIIGLSQLKHLLGVPMGRSQKIQEVLIEAASQIGNIHWITLIIGLAGMVLILGIKKLYKSIPGSLLAVIVSIIVVQWFHLEQQGVKVLGAIPQGLPALELPRLDWANFRALLPTTLAITLVSFMESIAVATAIQNKHKNYKVLPNQELIALGISKIGGAFFQAFPVSGGFSRTAVNDQAGARTPLAGVFSAVLIVLTLLFLTPLFHALPNAILASVIMVAVFGLIDVREPVRLWKANRTDFWMLMVTFAATLSLGIIQGIGIGVVLSLVMVIYRTTKPHLAELGKVPGTTVYRNVDRFPDIEKRDDLLIIRFDAQLYFANINYFRSCIDELITQKGSALQAVIINAESINNMDSSALRMIDEMVGDLRDRHIDIYFTSVKGPVRDALAKGNLLVKIGLDHFHMIVQDAVDAYDARRNAAGDLHEDMQAYTLQTNT